MSKGHSIEPGAGRIWGDSGPSTDRLSLTFDDADPERLARERRRLDRQLVPVVCPLLVDVFADEHAVRAIRIEVADDKRSRTSRG